MKNPGWANNRGSPPYISRNPSYQIPPFPNAPAAMTFKAKAACGDEDGSLSILGLCSDFYVSKRVPTSGTLWLYLALLWIALLSHPRKRPLISLAASQKREAFSL